MSTRNFVMALAAVFTLAMPSLADDIVVPEGETVEITFTRPPLGQAGDPTSAKWVDGGTGKPAAFDEDFIDDDFVGWAKAGDPPGTATIEIENKGGNLTGPNGRDVTGGLDGDCIELYVRWRYKYRKLVTKHTGATTTVEAGGVGGSSTEGTSETIEVWAFGYKESVVKVVCPC